MSYTQLDWPGESASSWLQSLPLQGSCCFFQLLFQAHHGLCLAPLYYICEGLRVTPGLSNSAALLATATGSIPAQALQHLDCRHGNRHLWRARQSIVEVRRDLVRRPRCADSATGKLLASNLQARQLAYL